MHEWTELGVSCETRGLRAPRLTTTSGESANPAGKAMTSRRTTSELRVAPLMTTARRPGTSSRAMLPESVPMGTSRPRTARLRG